MTELVPRDPNYANRLRDSFSRQQFMHTLGADLTRVEPGLVEMQLPYREALGQQHGFFHGGVIGSLADNVGGYAAFTMLAAQDSLLTVEYKINIVAPGRGDRLIAVGTILKPGRRLTICEGRIFAETGETRKLCAVALCTLMTMENMSDEKTA